MYAYESADLRIVGSDGTYLGRTGPEYGRDAITNSSGTYGGTFSNKSVMNKYSKYGNSYGKSSAMNPYASDPPRLYRGKQFVGYLTTNKGKYPRIDPTELAGKKKK